MPKGSELTISDTDELAKATPGWAKIKSIKSGTPASATVGQSVSPHAPYGYVFIGELDPIADPKPLDSVVILKQPYAVNAGDVIGQIGHYLRYSDAKLLPAKPTRPLLHLEVFAGPELQAFITKSRDRAKQLPAAKTFLEISQGACLVSELPEPDQKLQPGVKLVPLDAAAKGKWIKVQPKTAAPVHGGRHTKPTYTDSGPQVWIDGSLANTTTAAVVSGWKDFPLSVSNAKGPGADFRDVFRLADLNKGGSSSIAKDDKGRTWFLVTIGVKDGSTRTGWVCEQDHPLVRMCGPWDWPGFELVDNSSLMPIDMLKRYIHVTEQYLVDESKTEFESSAAKVNASPFIASLEKAIDTNHDGKVTALELKHAQETPWMAEALSHLVVRCESEWGGGLGKWDALSPLMKQLLWLWKTEIERIGKLQWWEQVTSVEGFPKEPSPWHFHPIGIVGNFRQDCNCINIDRFIEEYKNRHSDDFGWYESARSPKSKLPPLNDASERNLRTLLTGIKSLYIDPNSDCNIPHIAYMLATSRIESYDFINGIFFGPIREGISKEKAEIDYGCGPTARRPAVAKANGNTEVGDGYKYRGRGLVQITWKNAYRKFGQILNLPLAENPDLAIDWDTALKIMVIGMRDGTFTGHSLSEFLNESQKNYIEARRIINSTDKANIFSEYAEKFEKLLIETRS